MIRNWLHRHPLSGFFALAFGISGAGLSLFLLIAGFDMSPLQPLEGGFLFVMMLLGPSLSGLICTALLGGNAGLRAIGLAAINWRVRPRWFAVALLTMPVAMVTLLLLLGSFADPAFLPRFQWTLLAVGLIAGSIEEIGWTGFATPRLLVRHSLGRAGLTLGLVWAVWHLLVDFRYNIGSMGPIWPLEFAVVYLATLTPYRMLMTWVFARTQSLLLAMLMHASFTGWLMALFPATSLPQSLGWQSAFAIILWSVVAVVLWRTNAGKTGVVSIQVVAQT